MIVRNGKSLGAVSLVRTMLISMPPHGRASVIRET